MHTFFKQILLFAVVLALLITIGACATKPEAAPEANPEAQMDQDQMLPPDEGEDGVVIEDAAPTGVDALVDTLKGLKAKAFSYKLYDILPEDYRNSEDNYVQAMNSYSNSSETVEADLQTAIDSYTGLISKGAADIAKDKRQQAEQMKDTALIAGASTTSELRFNEGELLFLDGDSFLEVENNEAAITSFEESRIGFEASYKHTQATDLKSSIDKGTYFEADPSNYEVAEAKYKEEEAIWASGKKEERPAGIDSLDEAIQRYTIVYQRGREAEILQARAKADEARDLSDTVKSNVAAKSLYNDAQNSYNDGIQELATKEYDTSLLSFARAEEFFTAAYNDADKKKASAEDAIKQAEEAAMESQRKALEADPLIQGKEE